MRASAVPDPVIAAVLGCSLSSLDRLERRVKDRGGRRDPKSRQAFGYALRRMSQAARRASEEGLDPFNDPRFLRAMIDFWEAMADCWRAEQGLGLFTAWLPVYRHGPFTELRFEVVKAKARISEIEGKNLIASLDEAEAARARRRAAAHLRIVGNKRRRPMTLADYRRLSADERAEIERDLGLETPPAELRKFDVSYDDGRAA